MSDLVRFSPPVDEKGEVVPRFVSIILNGYKNKGNLTNEEQKAFYEAFLEENSEKGALWFNERDKEYRVDISFIDNSRPEDVVELIKLNRKVFVFPSYETSFSPGTVGYNKHNEHLKEALSSIIEVYAGKYVKNKTKPDGFQKTSWGFLGAGAIGPLVSATGLLPLDQFISTFFAIGGVGTWFILWVEGNSIPIGKKLTKKGLQLQEQTEQYLVVEEAGKKGAKYLK